MTDQQERDEFEKWAESNHLDYAERRAMIVGWMARAALKPDGMSELDANKHEREILQVIDERDAAEEALSQAYYLVTGHSPQWSNLFGHQQAHEDIHDAVELLKAPHRKPKWQSEPPTSEGDWWWRNGEKTIHVITVVTQLSGVWACHPFDRRVIDMGGFWTPVVPPEVGV